MSLRLTPHFTNKISPSQHTGQQSRRNTTENTRRHVPVAVAQLARELAVGGRVLHEERIHAAVAVRVGGHAVTAVRLVQRHLSFL
jgi:hypothetical protein